LPCYAPFLEAAILRLWDVDLPAVPHEGLLGASLHSSDRKIGQTLVMWTASS